MERKNNLLILSIGGESRMHDEIAEAGFGGRYGRYPELEKPKEPSPNLLLWLFCRLLDVMAVAVAVYFLFLAK